MVHLDKVDWQGRAHFFAVCAQAMRRILISYARMKKADKRGAGAEHVPIENAVLAARTRPGELLALDDALASYRWLLATGIEASCIVIAGDSAGGGLTVATLVALRDAGVPLPAAAVLGIQPGLLLVCHTKAHATPVGT